MPEYLCKEITADVIGTYLSVFRATCAYRSEHSPRKLAGELINFLSKRGRQTVEIAQSKPRRKPFQHQPVEQSAFLVNGQVLVLVLNVVHLNDGEREALDKLISGTTCVVGFALNFGNRSPEFWRTERSTTAQKGVHA